MPRRLVFVAAALTAALAAGCTAGEAATRPVAAPTGSAPSVVDDAPADAPVAATDPAVATTTPRAIPRPAAYTEGRRKLVGVGIPDVAARAYLNASVKVRDISGSCNVPVEILAAIGRIESDHGRVAELDEYGRTREILRGFDSTGPDTDGGSIDGDPTKDWAVGPMQFIPDSWKAYGHDGDGDGVADPSSFFDAALSTAWYLCDKVGGFSDVTVLNGQWIAWDQQVASAKARFDANHQRWQQLHERRTALGFLLIANPTDAVLAQQFAAAPDPGPEPQYVEPAKPAGPAQFELAMQRYYGPVGKEGDDYIASTASVFRTLEQQTLGTPVSDDDRVEPR
ncbi:MAG: lytic transglycosylase domain-containing protein [Acidimicrobiales bacterium]